MMVVFKGQPKGRIARTEFSSYPTTNMYRCQANAWMDEAVMVAWVDEVVMLAWVDDILRPYVQTDPDNVIPLLILNSYQ